MPREDTLSAVLSEFARTLVTDFPIQGILDHLVERIVDVLPITAAGVTLITEERAPRYIAASNRSALRFEQLQSEIGQGPCLSAYESGEAVSVPDLATDDRYPQFAPAAIKAGLAAVFTFPLRHGEGWLGALDLYRDTPGDLDARDMVSAQTLADVAAAYLINAEARDEARRTSEYFRHGSLHDPLSGLPNRLLLEQRLEHAGQRARRSQTSTAVLFVDLDRFKQVNDAHGHLVGDELLLAIAQRLSGLVRPGDTLARFSGDEFVFLCEDLNRPADAEVLAKRITAAFASPFELAGVGLTITASVGLAYAGPGVDITHQLLATADVAMYQAKRRGGARHQITLIDPTSTIVLDERSSIEEDLRTAFARDQLAVAYQPIVRSADGLVTGVEALLRWTHPVRGAVPPSTVIGVAEHSGLISDIGAWVLERSCRDHEQWLRRFPATALDLAVNVSARQLLSANFPGTVAGVLAKTAMDPAFLTLEITENTLIEDSERAVSALVGLKELGLRLALDDFGTGFSSLSYLQRLPVDIVKIDQGFIADIGRASTGGAIVAAVTHLAHVFGLTVTAEGVETTAQRDEVRTTGCESAQGFYYARPMPAAEISLRLGADGPLHLTAARQVPVPVP